jgi:hypothetical protein
VIGIKKFIDDVWGDTVNTASRLESHAVPGRIQVSRPTYERLRDRYAFEPRGEVDLKRRRPERATYQPASQCARSIAHDISRRSGLSASGGGSPRPASAATTYEMSQSMPNSRARSPPVRVRALTWSTWCSTSSAVTSRSGPRVSFELEERW